MDSSIECSWLIGERCGLQLEEPEWWVMRQEEQWLWCIWPQKLWAGYSNCNVILSFRKPVKTFTIYLISEGKNTFDVDWNKKKKSLLITHSDSDLRLMFSVFLAGCNYRSPLDTCRILAQLCNNVFTSLSASEGTARGAVLQITHQRLPVTINI